MKHLYTCKFNYSANPHLSQLYAGFEELEAKGIVELHIVHTNPVSQPVLEVIVNNHTKVVYDMMDGCNWINGTQEEKMKYYAGRFNDADYIFKRSYDALFAQKNAANIRPLGLNYPIKVKYLDKRDLKTKAKNLIRSVMKFSGLMKGGPLYSEQFEYWPVMNKENRILFQTRLWDPEEATNESDKQYRSEMNESRIQCIRVCKKEFGRYFTGGITADAYAKTIIPELLVPAGAASKTKYLQTIREHNICIATTGLHGSTGWKMGEYVTAARAVITEPLNYELPGNFKEGVNYLDFSDTHELVNAIAMLNDDRSKIQQMMNENFKYYNEYLQPARLILNTLEQLTPDPR